MKTVIMIFLTVLLTSCSAVVVKKIGKPSKYAPANYQDIGRVKYLSGGADWIVEKRREDAFKQMHDSCDGAYEITREGNKTAFQESDNAFDNDYWMIEFRCTNKTANN